MKDRHGSSRRHERRDAANPVQTQKAFCYSENSSSGIGLRCRPEKAPASDTAPDKAVSLELRKCTATVETAPASSLLLVPAPPARRARTRRATEPRCMRRRAEAEVGVWGGDAGGATVAKVEQDQRERSLSSLSAGQSPSIPADKSPSSGNNAVTGVRAFVGVDSAGEGGCVTMSSIGPYSAENGLDAALYGTRGGESVSVLVLVDGVANDQASMSS